MNGLLLASAILMSATSVSAQVFTPAPTTEVNMQGAITLSSPLYPSTVCYATITAKINKKGEGQITSFSTGNANPNCPVTGNRLPWKIKITDEADAIIVSGGSGSPGYTGTTFGDCTFPDGIPLLVDTKGIWHFGWPQGTLNPNPCGLSTAPQTVPAETLTN